MRTVREQVGTQRKRLQGQIMSTPSDPIREQSGGEARLIPDSILTPPIDVLTTPIDNDNVPVSGHVQL